MDGLDNKDPFLYRGDSTLSTESIMLRSMEDVRHNLKSITTPFIVS